MGSYAIDGNQNAAANISILEVKRGASKRIKLSYLTVGSGATPADQSGNWVVQRTTGTVGVGTAVTPRPFDPAEGAAVASALENLTTEPTKTANLILLSFSFNTRANFQFYTNPGKEFIIANVANEGLTLENVIATGTQLHEATLHIDE